MGAVHSRSSRAAEIDSLRELHGIAFRRALRKQDRRLERDAASLRRRREGAAEPSRRRDDVDRPRVNDGTTIVSDGRRGRRETNGEEEQGREDDARKDKARRRRAAETMRALRLECARREAKARQRRETEREKRRADRRARDRARANPNPAPRARDDGDARTEDARDDDDDEKRNGSRFDELLAACAADETTAKAAARRRRERERRREASGRRSSRETSPDEENDAGSEDVFKKNGRFDAEDVASPCDALPLAAAAAAAAAAERRTRALNPPGSSRGGLRRKYEQVKVFRDGDSLFQCALLAELALRHEESLAEREPRASEARDRAAMRHAETVAAVLRRGVRDLSRADHAETTRALRAGAAARIAEARAETPPGDAFFFGDDFDVDAVDAAVVTAVNGAELLNGNMRACPPRGAPLDTWRRAMNEVGRRAEAELAAESADATLDDDDDDDATRRLERRAAFESAVRRVRRAYADEVARPFVPSSSLEVAALAAHLRRPIEVIRGPSRSAPAATPSAADASDAPSARRTPRAWRARCAAETFGSAHARRGRRGFAVFWELAEDVPDGLPAGDFSLLLPRRDARPDASVGSSGDEDDETAADGAAGFETDDGSDDVSEDVSEDGSDDVSDVSAGSVDDLLRGHAARSRRFAKRGFWSDRTPLSRSDASASDASDAGRSLWNSESERSFHLGSGSDVGADVGDDVGDDVGFFSSGDAATAPAAFGERRARVPSFLR